MKTFCLTSGAWLGAERNKAWAIMARCTLHDANATATILIDNAAVAREVDAAQGPGLNALEIDLRHWVTESVVEGGVLNVDAIRRAAASFPADRAVVVINATGFMSDIITKMITHLRIGLYSSQHWPCAIALVCDDVQQYQITQALAHAFYIRPAVITDTTIDRHVRNLRWQGDALRRFGARLGSFAARLQRMANNSHAAFERKLAKRRGWIWEE